MSGKPPRLESTAATDHGHSGRSEKPDAKISFDSIDFLQRLFSQPNDRRSVSFPAFSLLYLLIHFAENNDKPIDVPLDEFNGTAMELSILTEILNHRAYQSDLSLLRRLYAHFDEMSDEKAQDNLVGEVIFQIAMLAMLIHQEHDFAEECLKKLLSYEDYRLLALFFLHMLFVTQAEWERLATFYQEWAPKVDPPMRTVLQLQTAWLHLTRIPNINKVQKVLAQIDGESQFVLESKMELFRITEDWQALHGALSTKLLRATDPAEKSSLLFELARIEHGTFLQEEAALNHYRDALDSPIDGFLLNTLKRIVSAQNIEQILLITHAAFYHFRDAESKAALLLFLAERIAGHPDVANTRKSLYKEALELDPENAFAAGRYEEMLFVGRDWDSLIRHFRKKFDTKNADSGWTWQLRLIGDLALMLQVEPTVDLPQSVVDLFDRYWLLKRQQRWARLTKRSDQLSELIQQEIDLLSEEDYAPEEFLHTAMIVRAFFLFRRQFNYAQAQTLLLGVLEKRPSNIQAIAGLLEIQVMKSEPEPLPEALVEAIEAFPTSQEAGLFFSVIGLLSQYRLDDTAMALDAYEKALERGFQSSDILRSMKAIYCEQKQWEKVVDIIDRQLEINDDRTDRAKLAFEKGEILQFHLRRDDYVVAYAHSVSYDPKNLQYVMALGQIYEQSEEWDKLISLYKRFLRKYSRDTRLDSQVQYDLSLKIAGIYENNFNDIFRASRAYAQIQESFPDKAEITEHLDTLTRREQEVHRQIQTLHDRLRQTSAVSDVVQLNAEIGNIYYTHGDLANAAKYFQENRTLDKSHTGSLHKLQEIYSRSRRWKELKDIYEAELQRVTEKERRLFLLKALGEIYEKHLGDIQETFEKYEEALTLDPHDLEIIKALQQIYSDLHRWNKYVEFLKREVDHVEDPQQLLQLYYEMGVTFHERLNDLDGAVECFSQVLAYDRKHLRALNSLEKIHKQTHRWKELTDVLATKAQLVTDPIQRSRIYQSLGTYFEERLSNVRAALENHIVAFLCNKNNRAAFKSLERIYQEQQNWEDILGIYETAIDEVEKHGTKHYDLEKLYVKKGQVELFHLGQYNEAIASFRKGLQINPLNETCFGSLKTIFLQHRDWDNLIDLYEQRAIQQHTDARKVTLYYEVAELCESRLRDTELAVGYYERILELDRFQEDAFKALDTHYQALHRWEDVIRLYQLRLTVARNGEDVLVYLQKISGIYEKKLREFEKAIYFARKMLQVAPANSTALRILSRLYELNKMWDELIEISLREVRITTDFKEQAYIYFRIGSLIETQIKDDEEAIKYYREAIKCDEKCFPALHGIREIYFRKEQWDRVIEFLQVENQLWEGEKEKSSILYRVGEIYLEKLYDVEQAIESFEKAIEVHQENTSALQALLRLYFEDDAWPKAIEVARTLTEKASGLLTDSQKADAFYKRGVIARQLSFMLEAADSFKIALEYDPAHADALRCVAELYVSKQIETSFQGVFFRLEKTFLDQNKQAELARLYRYRGLVAESDYHIDEALQYYGKSLELMPSELEYLFSLVNFYVKLRQWPNAISEITQFLKGCAEKSDLSKCYALMARIYGDFMEDHEQAIGCYRELLRLNPNDTRALFSIVQHQFVLAQYDEALITINQVIERAKTSGSTAEQSLYYYYLGRVMQAGFGDEEISLEYYTRARNLDRQNVQAIVGAGRVYQRNKDWKNFEKLYRTTIPALAKHAHLATQIPLRMFFAEGFIGKGDYSIALEEFESILALDPTNVETHYALSTLALEHLSNVDLAIKHLSAVAERDVTSLKAYHKIGRTYQMQSFQDKAYCVYKVLECFMATRAPESKFLHEYQDRIVERRAHPQNAITAEILQDFIREPLPQRSAVKEVWDSLGEYLIQHFLLPTLAEPLPKKDAVSAKSNRALATLLDHIYGLLQVEPIDIYVRNGVSSDISLEKTLKWGIILSEDFLSEKYTANEQIFLLTQHIATQLEADSLLLKISRDELDGLYQLMLDIVRTFLDDKTTFALRFAKMPKRIISKLETVVEKHAINDAEKLKLEEFHALVDCANQTRARVGHTVAGDIVASVSALLRTSHAKVVQTQEARIAAIKDSNHLQDLIRYHISERHFFVRSFLGIAI